MLCSDLDGVDGGQGGCGRSVREGRYVYIQLIYSLVQQKTNTTFILQKKRMKETASPFAPTAYPLNPGNQSAFCLFNSACFSFRPVVPVLHLTPGYYSTPLLLLFSTKASWLGHRAGSRANSAWTDSSSFFFLGMRALPEPLTGYGSCTLTNAAAVEGPHPPLPQPAVPHQSRRALCGQPARTSSVPRACQEAAGKEARAGSAHPSAPNTLIL